MNDDASDGGGEEEEENSDLDFSLSCRRGLARAAGISSPAGLADDPGPHPQPIG